MGKQWTPPASDAPVENTWSPPSTDVELKKKANTPVSANTADLSGNGLNPFQSSPQSTDLTPVLPEHRDEVRQQQQNQTKQLSDKLKSIYNGLDEEHKKGFNDAINIASRRQPDELRQPTQKELDHDAFMQTPVGKTLGAINYLSSKATKGTLQVAKGAAYLANNATNTPAIANLNQMSIDDAFKKADENTNFGLSKGDQQRMADNPITGNLGGLAEFIPSAAAAGETGGATFYLQGLGQGKEAADQAEKQSGQTINPNVKHAFILGTGLVNGALMGDLGGNMFKSLPAGLRGDITASITANAIKDASGKELTGEVFKELLDNGAKTFTDKLAKGGVQALEGYKHAVTNLSALATANFALKKGVDVASDKPVFNESAGNLASNLSDIATKQAPFFAIPSALDAATKLTPYSEYKNSVVENLMHDSSPENVEKTKQDIANYGQQHEWKPDEIQATTDHVDKIAQVAKSLPKNIPDAKVSDAVDLVLGRNKLQEELKQEQDTRKQLDPAVQDVVSPNEQMLTDKVEQANDKLRDIVTGTKTTYSKGIGEEEGKFFKTTDGKKEEISPSRYQLEVTERPTKNEQAEPTQEVPAKTPADETGGKETPVIPTDETGGGSEVVSESEGQKRGRIARQSFVNSTENTPYGIQEIGDKVIVSIDEKTVRNQNGFRGGESILPHENTEVELTKDEKKELRRIERDKELGDIDVKEYSKQKRELIKKVFKRSLETELPDETTENSPIKPTENEKSTEEHEETKASQEKDGKGSDESSESSQDGEKSNDVNQTGGAETSPVIKPRFQIKQGKVVPLPLKEHAELNAMLKSDHGITIQDIKDEQSQRNASGDQNTETPTNAEAVRQPENDGTGNVGKNRPSETTQGAESGKKPSETVGVANADVSKERGQEVERTHKTREEIENEGKRLINDGELDPDKFAKEIIDSPKPITAEEQAALRYHKTKLNNKQRALIKDTEANPDNASDNKIEYARNEDLIEQNRKATEIAGNETGRALGDRTAQLAEDYSRVNVLNRAKMANNGEPLDPKDEAELEMRTKRIQELEGKLADREEELRKAIENGLVDKVNRAANHEERQAKREVTKATLRKEREGLVAELHLIAKKSMGSAGANKIPVDMIVPLTKLARNYVLDGVVTLSGVVDKLYDDLKEHVEGLKKDEIADVIKDNFSQYLSEQNAIRLERSKKLQKTKLEKLKEGTFEKKTYGKIQVDNDYLNIRAEINREQMKINKKIADIENSQKNIGRKALDFAVKWGRQLKLASITVLGKLTAAGLTTVGIEPVNEGVGKVVSKLAPEISKKAYGQGSVSRSAMHEASDVTEGQAVKSLSEAYARAATKGMKDAYDEARAAGSTLSALYSEKKGKLPPEAAEFFGHLHSAIKAPVKRFAFEKSYARRVAKTIENGLDPLDPIVDVRNRLDAYKDAERSIFMGDNWLSSQYENATGAAERSKYSSVRTVGGIARILFPFVKVPTNIVLETARYAGGLVPGIAKIAQVTSSTLARRAGAEGLARFIHKGMGELTPEESDIVLRNLKRGSVGAAALAIGFFNPKAVGGFYQPGEKRKKNEANADSFMIDGHKVPMWLTEHPIFQAMQLGSTFRRLLEAHKRKDDKYEAATLGTLSGISQNIPLAEGAKQITEALGGTKKLNTYIASVIKGETIPAFLQQLAVVTDTKDDSMFSFEDKNQVKRAPDKKHGLGKMIKQTLETGVPGLREDVPRKH